MIHARPDILFPSIPSFPPLRSFLAPAPITEECGRKQDGAGVELGGWKDPHHVAFLLGRGREGGKSR